MNRLDTLRAMEEKQPNDAFVKYAIALEFLGLGQTDDALQYFEHLVEKHPEYVPTYLHLGKLYESLGMLDKSLETYKKGIVTAKHAGDKKAMMELNEAFLLAEDE